MNSNTYTVIEIACVIALLICTMSMGLLYAIEHNTVQKLSAELSVCRGMIESYEEYTDECVGMVNECLDLYDDMRAQVEAYNWAEAQPRTITRFVDNPYLPEFVSVAREVADSQEYEMDTTNCEWFTKHTVSKLNDLGYDAQRVLVVVDCESGMFDPEPCAEYEGRHAITRLDSVFIESTTGKVISPEDYGVYGIDWRVES